MKYGRIIVEIPLPVNAKYRVKSEADAIQLLADLDTVGENAPSENVAKRTRKIRRSIV